MQPSRKIAKVMREYKSGKLKSSSGYKVTSHDQAVAIALSEAGMSKRDRGFCHDVQTASGENSKEYKLNHKTIKRGKNG